MCKMQMLQNFVQKKFKNKQKKVSLSTLASTRSFLDSISRILFFSRSRRRCRLFTFRVYRRPRGISSSDDS